MPTSDLRQFTNLESVGFWGVQTSNGFDTQDFSQIKIFTLKLSQFDTLDISSMTQLESLELAGNLELRQLDLTYNTALKEIYIDDSPIEDLELTGLTELKSFDFNATIFHPVKGYYESPISTLDFSNNKKLETIEIGGAQLDSIELIGLESLQSVAIVSPLESSNLDLINLNSLWLSGANFSKIDLSLLPELEVLYLGFSKLTSVDFSHNHKLRRVHLKNNNLNEETLAYLKTLPDSIEVIID